MITKKILPTLSEVHSRGLTPGYSWRSGWPDVHTQHTGSDFSYDHVEDAKRCSQWYKTPSAPEASAPLDEARTASRIGRLSDAERRELITGLEQLRETVRRRYTIHQV